MASHELKPSDLKIGISHCQTENTVKNKLCSKQRVIHAVVVRKVSTYMAGVIGYSIEAMPY